MPLVEFTNLLADMIEDGDRDYFKACGDMLRKALDLKDIYG